jgi:hypothetical protein
MKKYIPIISLAMVLLFILTPGCKSETTIKTTTIPTEPIPSPYLKAPVDVNITSDGETVNVNLVRFIGKMPTPDATVLVNGNPVTIDDTNYYAYLDLHEGQNGIEVKTVSGAETRTDNINLYFDPPLTCHLSYPNFDPKVNYLENPNITINGDVSKPSARVEVNERVLEVPADGTFTTSYTCVKGSNHVTLVATLHDETDIYGFGWLVGDNGHYGINPGGSLPFGNNYKTSLIESDHNGLLTTIDYKQTINLKAGESTILDFGISIGKEYKGPLAASVALVGSTVPDLQVKIEPTSYTAYPKIQYYSPVSISAGSQLAPGDYHFTITYTDTATSLSLLLTVSVN